MSGKADPGDILEEAIASWARREVPGSMAPEVRGGVSRRELSFRPPWARLAERVGSNGLSMGKAESRLGPRAPKNILMLSPFSAQTDFSGRAGLSFPQIYPCLPRSLDGVQLVWP